MGQHKEREDQDILVPAVEPDGHQQTTRVAHRCATGAWRSVYQPVPFQEASSTGHPSMAFSEGKRFE
jgi:hypothetical protein